MKRNNPVRALLEDLRKDTRKDVELSPDEARLRRAVAAGFRRLSAWKKRPPVATRTSRKETTIRP